MTGTRSSRPSSASRRVRGRCTARAAGPGAATPVSLSAAGAVEDDELRRPVGIGELDRVLGGGLVAGSVVLLGGEPGIGKSTLLLQAAAGVAASGATVLYATGEESASQVRLRAGRLGLAGGPVGDAIRVVAETGVGRIVDLAREELPGLLVIDSIQTVASEELDGPPGSVGQVREAAQRLMELAKAEGVPVILVGHVTKDGTLAGPKTLEHLVDVVLSVEGDRTGGLRLLRATKNRYGSTEEVGVFEMGERGLTEVADPARAFLADHDAPAPGSVVAPVLEGSRPILVEVQALVAPTAAPSPRRTASGVDPNRLALLVAVLGRRAGIGLSGHDVYANLAGGLLGERARPRPAARPGARVVAPRPAGRHRARSPSARSGCWASCARWAASIAGCARPRGSGSRGRSCRDRAAARCRRSRAWSSSSWGRSGTPSVPRSPRNGCRRAANPDLRAICRVPGPRARLAEPVLPATPPAPQAGAGRKRGDA